MKEGKMRLYMYLYVCTPVDISYYNDKENNDKVLFLNIKCYITRLNFLLFSLRILSVCEYFCMIYIVKVLYLSVSALYNSVRIFCYKFIFASCTRMTGGSLDPIFVEGFLCTSCV